MKTINYTLLKNVFLNLSSFTDHDDLRSLSICMKNNAPIVVAGGMAMVGKMKAPDGNIYAVKIWLRNPSDNMVTRYTKMQAHRPLSPYLHYGDYIAGGVKLGDKYLDVYKTEWLNDYASLNEYIEYHKTDIAKLKDIAIRLEELFKKMKSHGLVHGDLHPENIKVKEQDIKIIDLDSLTFPDQLPSKSTIKGYPAYQHPGRTDTIYKNTDDVSMLSILTAIYGTYEGVSHFQNVDYNSDLGISQRDIIEYNDKNGILQLTAQSQGKGGKYASNLISVLSQAYPCNYSLYVPSKKDIVKKEIHEFFKKRALEASQDKDQRFNETRKAIKNYFNSKAHNRTTGSN